MAALRRYESILQQVDAVHWTGSDHAWAALASWLSRKVRFDTDTNTLNLQAGVDGAQGWVPVPLGHWIVSQPGDISDVWPVDPDYFRRKYRLASENETDGLEDPGWDDIGDPDER